MKPWKVALSIFLALSLGLWIFGPILFHDEIDHTKVWIGKTIPEGKISIRPDEMIPVSKLLTGPKNILSFWADWCGPCISEMPEINRHIEELKKAGIHVSMINVNSGISHKIYAEMQAWLIAQKLTLSSYYDFNSEYMDRFEVPSLPLHVAVDPQGKILWIKEGAMSWALNKLEKRF